MSWKQSTVAAPPVRSARRILSSPTYLEIDIRRQTTVTKSGDLAGVGNAGEKGRKERPRDTGFHHCTPSASAPCCPPPTPIPRMPSPVPPATYPAATTTSDVRTHKVPDHSTLLATSRRNLTVSAFPGELLPTRPARDSLASLASLPATPTNLPHAFTPPPYIPAPNHANHPNTCRPLFSIRARSRRPTPAHREAKRRLRCRVSAFRGGRGARVDGCLAVEAGEERGCGFVFGAALGFQVLEVGGGL